MRTSKAASQSGPWLGLLVLLSAVGACAESGESKPPAAVGGAAAPTAGRPSVGDTVAGVEASSVGGAAAPTAGKPGVDNTVAGAGAPSGKADCGESSGSCVLDVLAATVDTTYEYASLEQKVAALPQTSLVSVTDSEIASMAAEPASASRIELRLTGEAASLHTASLERALLHPFRLSCGGKSLFVGVVYQLEGAAALRTPVLHVGRDAENRLVLRLGAWQGAWLGLTSSGDAAAKSRIDRAELRAPFCRRGVLSELASGRR